MAYVASLLKPIPMLAHPSARVLIVVKEPVYAKVLFDTIRERAAEGVEPWKDGTFFISQRKVDFPNEARLLIRAVEDKDDAYAMAGMYFSNILYGKNISQDIVEWMRRLARMPGDFTGTVSCQQFEEWRENPLQQPKEPDDKALL